MIALFIILLSLVLELSLGGFLGIMQGSFHIYAFTCIVLLSFINIKNISRVSFFSGLMYDLFLNSQHFFGIFLILYIFLGYFILWIRSIFFKTSDRIVIFSRLALATAFYFIFSVGSFFATNFFSKNEYLIFPRITIRFLLGEVFGLLTALIAFMVIWEIFLRKKLQ